MVRYQSRIPSQMANKYFVKLRYATTYLYDQLVGQQITRRYSGNSLHDPDHTGAGHQPNSYDQFTAFYTKWRVRAAKIKVIIHSTSAVGINGLRSTILQTKDSAIALSPEAAMEQPGAVTGITSPNTQPTVLKRYATTKGIYPDTHKTINCQGAIGQNPVNQWFYQLSLDGTVAGQTNARITVIITYYAQFSSPISLTES